VLKITVGDHWVNTGRFDRGENVIGVTNGPLFLFHGIAPCWVDESGFVFHLSTIPTPVAKNVKGYF